MKTLESIYHIISEFAQKQEAISANSEKLYNDECRNLEEIIKKDFKSLRSLMPELLQIEYDDSLTKEEASELFEQIKANSMRRFAVDLLPVGGYYIDTIQGKNIYTPQLINWQLGNPSGYNFVINYTAQEVSEAEKYMKNLVMNILLSLPAKSIHLSFVDLSLSGGYEFFTKNLDSSICGKAVMGGREFEELIASLIERMRSALQNYGEAVRYNIDKQTIKVPYELVVLTNYPKNYNNNIEDLLALFENGYKGGIYFLVMNNTDVEVDDNYQSLIRMRRSFQLLMPSINTTNNQFINATPIMSSQMMRKLAIEYLNREATRKEELPPLKAEYQSLIDQQFEDVYGDLSVPVGETTTREKIIFKLSTIGHIHSFILGQSGSGKSVFLHNVITGLIAKYSPEDLHLYLLDFKLGGVEFNRYKDEKHVKALLVDNSDIQITLEILRNISDKMRERGKLLRASGVSSIADYNKMNPSKRMPQMLLIADECHVMFNPEGRNNLKQYSEISDIIIKIAKEGRSQGVHLILATQTLAQTEISNEILNNISDHYLLKCAASDSEKMVRDSSEVTNSLTTGQVYYHGRDDSALFQAYFVPTNEGVELVENIKKKTQNISSQPQFYFVGSQVFTIDSHIKELLSNAHGNFPIAAVGRSIDIKQNSVNISLREDDAENIMLFGIDDEHQVTKTTLSLLRSIKWSTQSRNITCRYAVLNFLADDSIDFKLQEMKNDGIDLVEKRDAGAFFYQLCCELENHTVQPTVVFLIGQERFRDLKFDNAIDIVGEEAKSTVKDDFGFSDAGVFSNSHSSNAKYDTYRKALAYILDNGGEQGVHIVLQIDKPDKFLFDDYVTGKMVFTYFKHLIMLRSDENAANRLGISDDISLENLSSDPERLRAIYYNESSDSYTLLTPYR